MFINLQKVPAKRGFTLMEMLIAMGIGGMALAVISVLVFFTSRSFAALTNYNDLNQKTMRALDIITKELRQARGVSSVTADTIQFYDANNQPATIKYYDASHAYYARQVMLITSTTAEVLLEDCDSFKAQAYKRVPEKDVATGIYNDFPEVKAGDASPVKLIRIDWECYRDVLLGDKWTTESVQTAKIVVRHNPEKTL